MASEVYKQEEAKAKLQDGTAFDFILQTWQRIHHGDELLGRELLYSKGSQCALNTNGLHTLTVGETGFGKSDGFKAMGALSSPDYWTYGSVTPQSLYYQKKGAILDGTVIGYDDIVWHDETGATIKRITTAFQEGAERLSVDERRSGSKQRSSRRLAFWVSSVDSQADEQIRDRFFMYAVKSGEERAQEIIKHRQLIDAGTYADKGEDISICQSVDFLMKSQPAVIVDIPFSSDIKFSGTPRSYNMFADIIRSNAIWNAKLRDEEHGRIIAEKVDFESAKVLYLASVDDNQSKYTPAELKVLDAIVVEGKATYSDIKKATGLSTGRIGDLLNGKEKGAHGLLYKCAELELVEGSYPKMYRVEDDFNPRSKVNISLRR